LKVHWVPHLPLDSYAPFLVHTLPAFSFLESSSGPLRSVLCGKFCALFLLTLSFICTVSCLLCVCTPPAGPLHSLHAHFEILTAHLCTHLHCLSSGSSLPVPGWTDAPLPDAHATRLLAFHYTITLFFACTCLLLVPRTHCTWHAWRGSTLHDTLHCAATTLPHARTAAHTHALRMPRAATFPLAATLHAHAPCYLPSHCRLCGTLPFTYIFLFVNVILRHLCRKHSAFAPLRAALVFYLINSPGVLLVAGRGRRRA